MLLVKYENVVICGSFSLLSSVLVVVLVVMLVDSMMWLLMLIWYVFMVRYRWFIGCSIRFRL